MLFARATVALIAFSLFTIPAWPQRDSCRQRMIPVSIGTTDGGPVPPLDSANFGGTYRKKPIRVTSTAINQEPPRVVLLLDTSGSMRGMTSADERNFSVDLAEDLVLAMPAASEIGLGFFYNEFDPISLPTVDHKKLRFQLEALRSHPSSFRGRTALWDAILDSVKMFDRPHLGDAIYVITDGGDNDSKTKQKHVVQALREVGIRLFAFINQK